MQRILLVDDDTVILQIYRPKLQQFFEVETALDGLDAMKKLHSFKPDVLVLDIMMPKFSGIEVLNFIRSDAQMKAMRVIVLSNMFFGAEQRQSAAGDADLVFQKSSCTPAKLVEAIHKLLAGSTQDNAPSATNGNRAG